MFQSLIGRLKTNYRELQLLTLEWFQSLIGRLKTSVFNSLDEVEYEFQSLIGRLKTCCDVDWAGAEKYVSIPYR